VTDQPEKLRDALPIPLGLILWGVAALAILGALMWAVTTGRLTWSMAVDTREAALGFVAGYPVLAYAAFIGLFVLMAVALLPIQLWTIVFGAMLFGFWPAVVTAWFASILGALVVFVAARGVLAGQYRNAVSKYLPKVEREFQENQLLWMLTLRLVPIVPYCVGNVAPVFLGARPAPFAIATAIGVIPYVFVYAFAGDRASLVLDADTPPDLARLTAEMFPVMLAVAAVPVLALFVRWLLKRKR
jgi:uncharacterized membrane protein YdjX (TVP38/TMEM64 family)